MAMRCVICGVEYRYNQLRNIGGRAMCVRCAPPLQSEQETPLASAIGKAALKLFACIVAAAIACIGAWLFVADQYPKWRDASRRDEVAAVQRAQAAAQKAESARQDEQLKIKREAEIRADAEKVRLTKERASKFVQQGESFVHELRLMRTATAIGVTDLREYRASLTRLTVAYEELGRAKLLFNSFGQAEIQKNVDTFWTDSERAIYGYTDAEKFLALSQNGDYLRLANLRQAANGWDSANTHAANVIAAFEMIKTLSR